MTGSRAPSVHPVPHGLLLALAVALAGCSASPPATPQSGPPVAAAHRDGSPDHLGVEAASASAPVVLPAALEDVLAPLEPVPTTTTTTTAPPAPPTTVVSPPDPPATGESVWVAIASCETGRGGPPEWDYNPATATWGSRIYYGGLQFARSTWDHYAPLVLASPPAFAYLASPGDQIAVARRVQAVHGWGAWPACSRKLGLR